MFPCNQVGGNLSVILISSAKGRIGAGGPHDMLFCRLVEQHPVQQPQGVELQDVVLNIDDHLGPPLFPAHNRPGNIFKFAVIIS